jgi:uncharacterized protein YggE
MIRRNKTVYAIGLTVIAALLLAGCAGLASAQAAQPTDVTPTQRTISVTGSGQASQAPDVAVLTLGVDTQASQAAEAFNSNNTQMTHVIDALKSAGVAAKDIQTQALQLTPRYSQPPAGTSSTRELIGYTATDTVLVHVRVISQTGQLIDAAVQAGSNRIEGISFEISDPATVLEQARQAAWTDALAKAKQLASLSGVQLGDVLTISDSSYTPRPISPGISAAAVAPIQPGTQTMQVTLNVTWLLR